MGVAVSKIAMLTHCQALSQACNYCEGQSSVLLITHSAFCLSCANCVCQREVLYSYKPSIKNDF